MPPSTSSTRAATVSRLPSRPTARTERRREVRSGVLAVLGLLVVLVGVPLALALSVGNPLPDTRPSRDWLTAQVTAGTVLQVLACALWLAWAHFAVCVLAEWRAARRGSGVPSDVPLGGGSQHVARRLVAAALLLAGAATLVPSGGAASPAVDRSTSSISAVQGSAQAGASPVADAGVTTPTVTAPGVVAPAAPGVVAPAVQGPERMYVVAPPDGRRYDSLWDIAERTLGDPFRYKEIFELNRARVQDDGRKLVDANLIHPGWVLRMPADASGPGVMTPAVTPPPRQSPAVPSIPTQPGAAEQAAGELAAGGLAAGELAAGELAAAAAAPAAQETSLERLLLGGGLLAAGVLAALSARRGPYARPAESGPARQLRLAASPNRAALLDRALRGLAERCAQAGRPLPDVAVAYCDDHHVTLSLVGPSGEPPAPWTAVSDGRGWTVLASDLPERPPDVAAPYPALAGLALTEGTDVLVDLEAAPGIVSLEGDPAVARDVAASVVVELATNLWSDGVHVTVVGFGDDFRAFAPDRITAADALADVLVGLEDEQRTARGWRADRGVTDVLSGRLQRGAERPVPRVVVLSGPPAPQEASRLHALVADTRTPLAVVCVGALPEASWRFTADAAGGLDLGVLGLRAPARRLPREDYLPLLDAMLGADRDRVAAATDLAGLGPRAALEELTGAGRGAAGPAAGARPAPARSPRGLPAAQVLLLGPVEVIAPGHVAPAARPLLTELLVATALHPGGLHEAVLRAEVWPRGVSDDVLAATVAQAQAWLGSGLDGRPRLGLDAQGRYVLTEDVHTDWDVLQACAAVPDGPTQAADLGRGLALVRGEAFSTTGTSTTGMTGSLSFHRAARDARVVGTAVARRAASLAAARQDPAAAVAALRRGLTLVPASEPLWRDLLRLTAGTAPASCGTAGVQDLAREALETLARLGLRPEPETDALVRQLAPGVLRATA